MRHLRRRFLPLLAVLLVLCGAMTVTAFASVLDEALLSRLTWLLADNDTVRFDRQQVEDFIDKIRSRQLKKDSAEISGMDRQELDDYIKKLSEKKRG